MALHKINCQLSGWMATFIFFLLDWKFGSWNLWEMPKIVGGADKSHQKVIFIFSHHCSCNRFVKNDGQRGALSILMCSRYDDLTATTPWRGELFLKDVCLWSVRVWFDKRSEVWYRERERELIAMACAWLTGASEGQSPAPAKPRPLEQLFLHAAFGLVQWKEAYVWPGATLPPRLTAEDAGRGTERQAKREND